MKISGVVEGLVILQKYFDADGHHLGAGHDVIYVEPTSKPVGSEDLARLVELGWFQEEVVGGDEDFGVANYCPDEGWSCFV